MSAQPAASPRLFRQPARPKLAVIAAVLVGIVAAPLTAPFSDGTAAVGAVTTVPYPYVERALLANPLAGISVVTSTSVLSSDGSTVVIGSHNAFSPSVGRVAIYGRSGGTYLQIGSTLTDPGGSDINDTFGGSVAVSSDGATVVVGNPGSSNRSGAVYVYTKSGNGYGELGGAPIATGDATYNSVGSQVAMSGDGGTIVCLAYNRTAQGLAVLIYTRSGSVYSRQQVIVISTSPAYFGAGIAVSGDGTTLAIGSTGDYVTQGSVAVYLRSGATYTAFGGPLTASDGIAGNGFGEGITMSGDGATLVIGAGDAAVFPVHHGNWEYIFTKGASAYSQAQELVGVSGAALSTDGTTLVLEVAHSTPDAINLNPYIRVYRKGGGIYVPSGNGLPPFPGWELFGVSGVSGDGNTIIASGNQAIAGVTPTAVFTNTPIAGVGLWRGTTWRMANTLATNPTADLAFPFTSGHPEAPVLCDWSGTGAKQPVLFSPASSHSWLIGSVTTKLAFFGLDGDIPLCGDWTGQGKQTIGIFRNGIFALTTSNDYGSGPDIIVAFGQPGDIPVVGDWTGQGKQTIGIYRNGVFALMNRNVSSATADIIVQFGSTGDVPVVGDWTGSGLETVGVFRNGGWYLRNTNTSGMTADIAFQFGTTGDTPLVRSERANGVSGPGSQPRTAPTATPAKSTATASVTRNAVTATPVKGTATPNPLPPARP